MRTRNLLTHSLLLLITRLKRSLVALLIVFMLCAHSSAQDFHPAKPDTSALNKLQEQTGYSQTRAYLYLSFHYKTVTSKDSVLRFEWDPYDTCSFVQHFSSNIKYATWECKEAGGVSETIIFPKITTREVKKLVELLFYHEENTWTTELKYEPEGAGCYYEIRHNETQTMIEIYCGC